MGTLSSELAQHADWSASAPRIYADANVPAGVVSFMRAALGWDVLFVIEHADLRRAHDTEHYRLARQLHRTLITLDRDYLDDRRFPSEGCGGVLVISAPDEKGLTNLLGRIDQALFQPRLGGPTSGARRPALPLQGRKLHAHVDWTARVVEP